MAFTAFDFVLCHISCGSSMRSACAAEGISLPEFFLSIGHDDALARSYRTALENGREARKYREQHIGR